MTISSDGGQGEGVLGKQLKSLLKLNVGTNNQSHVAIKKILLYYPNIDMEQLFGWDSDDEESLKSSPYVMDWFERAEEAVNAGEEARFPNVPKFECNIDQRKLCHCNLYPLI